MAHLRETNSIAENPCWSTSSARSGKPDMKTQPIGWVWAVTPEGIKNQREVWPGYRLI